MSLASKPVDKRRARGEQNRKQILQAAISSIAALGLSNMTLDRVAERAGTSRSLVVFHFKSKNKLIEEVLDYLGSRYADGWEAVFAQPSESSYEKVLQLAEYDVRFAYDHPQYVSAWHAFWGESKGSILYQNLSFQRDREYADELKKLISAIIEEGSYDMDELESINASLGAMLFGVWIESHLKYDPEELQVYLKVVRLFLAKVFPRHSPTTGKP